MTTTEVTTTIRNLKELMNMKEELEAEITAAQDTIKAEMTAREVDELRADVFKVTCHEERDLRIGRSCSGILAD
jgi:hypothetical protein